MRRVVLVLFVLVARAHGCSCGGTWPSVKQAWQNAPFVFLGTVEMADPDEGPNQTIFKEQMVRIRVDEAFKGVGAGQTITLHQGASDCDAKFRTGQRFVFYLERGQAAGTWFVPWCTRSIGDAAAQGDDLLFLHGLPKSAHGTRLSGEVELYEESAQQAFHRTGGAANVSVMISGPEGFRRKTKTNGDGVYEVYNLPPGKYSVKIETPKGFRTKFPVIEGSLPAGDASALYLVKEGAASVNFILEADTRLSGRMLDASGRPIQGVCIDLEPVEGRGENGARFFSCSTENGAFSVEMMPPGKYWLVAHDEINGRESTSTLYYPSSRDRNHAQMILIEAGKYVEGLEIKLPSQEVRYQVAGRIEFADGEPAANAAITFTSSQHGYTEGAGANANGSFHLSIVAGMDGTLQGRLSMFDPILRSCPQLKVSPQSKGMFHFIDATPVPVIADSDRKDLKLVLDSPSCPALPPAH